MFAVTRRLALGGASRARASLSFSVALLAALVTVPARPARAAVGPVTNGRAFFVFFAPLGQQLTVPVGFSIAAGLTVHRANDPAPIDVTFDPNTSYTAEGGGGSGSFSGTIYTPVSADANKTFPLYVHYRDAATGQIWTFTISLHVVPAGS
jgi:hypothetical protein